MRKISERRSMKRFAAQEAEAGELGAVPRVRMAAPSAGSQRPWEFYIVRNREKLEALSQISRYVGPIAAAPLAIVTVCDPAGKRFAGVIPIDMAICTEHLWLGTVSEEPGSVWIGMYPFGDRVKSASRILGIPAGQFVLSVLPLGYSMEEKAPGSRFNPAHIHEM